MEKCKSNDISDAFAAHSRSSGRRGRFTSISVGRHHLLTLTSRGRAFALPISSDANSHGQLGTRKVQAFNSAPVGTETDASSAAPQQHSAIDLVPKSQLDPFANVSPFTRASDKSEGQSAQRKLVPLLYEIPSLRGITISKIVASDRSSYALTKDGGRVLAWGANEYGCVLGVMISQCQTINGLRVLKIPQPIGFRCYRNCPGGICACRS